MSALALLAAVAAYEVLGMAVSLLVIRRWIVRHPKAGDQS